MSAVSSKPADAKSFPGSLIVAGVLIVPAFLFWNWWSGMQRAGRADAVKASKKAPFGEVSMMKVKAGGGAPVQLAAVPAQPAAVEYQPRSRRDPMLSPSERVKAPPRPRGRRRPKGEDVESQIELQGIIGGAGGYRAMVNGRTLRVGDKILGATVTKIRATYVDFKLGDKTVRKKM